MSDRNFRELLEAQWSRGNFVCVGLDSDHSRIPRCRNHVLLEDDNVEDLDGQLAFNVRVIDATHDLVCAYKPNMAFYEALGIKGMRALYYTIRYIHRVAPEVPVILDAKRADIGNTNLGYVEAAFDSLQADAITVHPYLGAEALAPFLVRVDKGVIVLCRTSNPGAGEFQDVAVGTGLVSNGKPLYQYVAQRVASEWNKNGNCALVVGATYPSELQEVRKIVGDMPILIPGVGFQQKDVPLEKQVEQIVSAGKDSRSQGMIINSSRGIIFASKDADFAQAARRETEKLRDLINQYR